MYISDNNENLLSHFLECGTADLYILDDVGYDLGAIVDGLEQEGIKPTLNAITDSIFTEGVCELNEMLREKLDILSAVIEAYRAGKTDLTAAQEKYDEETFNELNLCHPWDDIEWHCNRLDTDIYFSKHADVYRKYLANEISRVEDNMGFAFQG